MNALAQWQAGLTGAIDGRPDDGICAAARTVPGLSATTGCEVYRRSSRGARAKALADVYPVCRRLLGERSFDGLAREFVRREPSTGPDLNRFGDGFAGFVDDVASTHAAFAGLPWLAELVALEWTCHSIYYASDDPPIDLGLLGRADPAELLARPAAALGWLRTRWPVHAIWVAHVASDDPPAMRIEPGDWYLVIDRHGFQARVQDVDPPLWQLLDACRQTGKRRRSLAELADDPILDSGRLGELVERRWLGSVELREHAV